jgi:hypothetical protein
MSQVLLGMKGNVDNERDGTRISKKGISEMMNDLEPSDMIRFEFVNDFISQLMNNFLVLENLKNRWMN